MDLPGADTRIGASSHMDDDIYFEKRRKKISYPFKIISIQPSSVIYSFLYLWFEQIITEKNVTLKTCMIYEPKALEAEDPEINCQLSIYLMGTLPRQDCPTNLCSKLILVSTREAGIPFIPHFSLYVGSWYTIHTTF